MTAVTASTPSSPFGRAWRTVRLLTTNPWTVIGWPLVILGAIFVMTWTIWWLIFASVDPADLTETADGIRFNGAVSYIFVYMLVISVQAVNLAFPLALGFGSTRRAFSLGSGLAFVLLSAAYAVVLTIGAWLEELTDGWGLHGAFFRTFYLATDAGWLAQWWIYFCWFVFFFFTGTIFAAMYVRWKALGLTAAFVALGVLVVATIAVLTLTATWHLFWEALAELGTIGIASAALVPAVLAAVVGYLVLRRATPRG
ncbi:MAG: ABC transporter permease [Micrococcales bacterium]|nr:ABC transporter permease [Micrococcales bacterium]OJX69246.1 MAG: hypothetical protein BGO94_11895 [Micrococcales bacterium 72-143]